MEHSILRSVSQSCSLTLKARSTIQRTTENVVTGQNQCWNTRQARTADLLFRMMQRQGGRSRSKAVIRALRCNSSGCCAKRHLSQLSFQSAAAKEASQRDVSRRGPCRLLGISCSEMTFLSSHGDEEFGKKHGVLKGPSCWVLVFGQLRAFMAEGSAETRCCLT
jgi:hypothetical protein